MRAAERIRNRRHTEVIMMAAVPARAMAHPRSALVLWLAAFTGFYRPDAESVRRLDAVSRFLYSARSVILVISVQGALLAGFLAARDHRFHLAPFVLILVAFVALHMISNLSNDYFGYRRGHDTPDSPRMRYTVHPLASGVLDARTLGTGLLILAGVAGAIAAYFVVSRGWLAVLLATVGLALLYLYDAAPVPLKSIGLGEVAAFIVWGPLMVGGGYAMIAGRISPMAFLASVPYGLGVMSILVGKHIDQLAFDARHGNATLPVALGEATARNLNRGLLALMYAAVVALIAWGGATPFCGLVAAALPSAIRAQSLLGRPRPLTPPSGYVGWPLWYHRACLVHNRIFGWLYVLGLGLGAVLPAVRL